MVIDPSSGFNKGGVQSTAVGSNKLKPTTPNNESTKADAGPASTDNVSLSSKAHAMARLESAVADAAEVDEAKVAELKQAVDNGSYQVNAESIAQKMLSSDL